MMAFQSSDPLLELAGLVIGLGLVAGLIHYVTTLPQFNTDGQKQQKAMAVFEVPITTLTPEISLAKNCFVWVVLPEGKFFVKGHLALQDNTFLLATDQRLYAFGFSNFDTVKRLYNGQIEMCEPDQFSIAVHYNDLFRIANHTPLPKPIAQLIKPLAIFMKLPQTIE
jgi:hypothetical protein